MEVVRIASMFVLPTFALVLWGEEVYLSIVKSRARKG